MNYEKLGFLPYQVDYLNDTSRIKLVEKSRQVGMTRTQAFEDVMDAGVNDLYNVWFSSNNDLNAKEYIRYCKTFAEALHKTVKDLTSKDLLTDTNVYCIEFANKRRITAVSSSPDQLHGKSGKIVLDEFARRENEFDTWEAGSPAALIWGYPIRIISTHKGKTSMFNKFITEILEGKKSWSHHKTTIEDAVNKGLADKVLGKKLTEQERQQWLDELRKSVGNPIIWAQQFMCQPQDEAESFMPYALLEANAKAQMLSPEELASCKTLYAGLDVGRYKNLTVLWIAEQITPHKLTTRFIRTIQGADFPQQEHIISKFLKLPNLRRLCIDKTGMGIGLVDYLQKRFGMSKVEGVTLTANTKEAIAFRMQKYLADHNFDIPNDESILADFNSVKQSTTAAGNIRLNADTNEDTGSHADYFWSATLCLEACSASPFVKPEVITSKDLKKVLKGFKKDF